MSVARSPWPRLRAIARESAIGFVFAVFVVVALAEMEQVDRPVADLLLTVVVLSAIQGARQAHEHRHSGRRMMLAWGGAAVAGSAAVITGMFLIAHAVGPSVRAQAWLPPVLVGLAAVGVIGLFVRSVIRESTKDGRAIAIGQALALCLVPLGMWLVATGPGELLNSVGAGLAISGPVILYWLQRERVRRGLEHGAMT
jgi:hypothetical protein